MRDPHGYVQIERDLVIRYLRNPIEDGHFLYNDLAKLLVENNYLVKFCLQDKSTIYSIKIPFVSFPYEWCDAQLYDAAILTLTISEHIISCGYELKDASAFNVIYVANKPHFCDHMSFQNVTRPQWWAFAQFIRHFVLPLTLLKLRKIHINNVFKISIDGATQGFASSVIGWKMWFTRFWPVMVDTKLNSRNTISSKQLEKLTKTYHEPLFKLCRWFLKPLKPSSTESSIWIDYNQEKVHYTADASKYKTELVKEYLNLINPKWVLDYGCNTGEFSKYAANVGASVVALDYDHDCIQALYRSSGHLPIYTVLATINDLAGGRGWEGSEYPSLVERLAGKFDVLLMLAIIHHLSISAAIPLRNIAEMAAKFTTSYLIVELIDNRDPKLIELANQRNRDPNDYSIEKQLESFKLFFNICSFSKISDSTRYIYLLKKF